MNQVNSHNVPDFSEKKNKHRKLADQIAGRPHLTPDSRSSEQHEGKRSGTFDCRAYRIKIYAKTDSSLTLQRYIAAEAYAFPSSEGMEMIINADSRSIRKEKSHIFARFVKRFQSCVM